MIDNRLVEGRLHHQRELTVQQPSIFEPETDAPRDTSVGSSEEGDMIRVRGESADRPIPG